MVPALYVFLPQFLTELIFKSLTPDTRISIVILVTSSLAAQHSLTWPLVAPFTPSLPCLHVPRPLDDSTESWLLPQRENGCTHSPIRYPATWARKLGSSSTLYSPSPCTSSCWETLPVLFPSYPSTPSSSVLSSLPPSRVNCPEFMSKSADYSG